MSSREGDPSLWHLALVAGPSNLPGTDKLAGPKPSQVRPLSSPVTLTHHAWPAQSLFASPSGSWQPGPRGCMPGTGNPPPTGRLLTQALNRFALLALAKSLMGNTLSSSKSGSLPSNEDTLSPGPPRSVLPKLLLPLKKAKYYRGASRSLGGRVLKGQASCLTGMCPTPTRGWAPRASPSVRYGPWCSRGRRTQAQQHSYSLLATEAQLRHTTRQWQKSPLSKVTEQH